MFFLLPSDLLRAPLKRAEAFSFRSHAITAAKVFFTRKISLRQGQNTPSRQHPPSTGELPADRRNNARVTLGRFLEFINQCFFLQPQSVNVCGCFWGAENELKNPE